jgi:hypothetical protein
MLGVEETVDEDGACRAEALIHGTKGRGGGEACAGTCSTEDHPFWRSSTYFAVRREDIVQW